MSDHDNKNNAILADLELGKPTAYRFHYAPELLQAVPRALNREDIGVADTQPFYGEDLWHAYELSWLNEKGKPVVRLVKCIVPATSPNIIESKSFKLYLNSFNQTKFADEQAVLDCLKKDLSNTAGENVDLVFFSPDDGDSFQVQSLPGQCLDDLDIEINDYELDAELLLPKVPSNNPQKSVISKEGIGRGTVERDIVEETLHTHLLKSNCLITNQPDWASVVIHYKGQSIDHESLLRYLVSFRMHNEFHEQCVERIFMDLYRKFKPETLSVMALYTRRGGLDINPYRSTEEGSKPLLLRTNRQ